MKIMITRKKPTAWAGLFVLSSLILTGTSFVFSQEVEKLFQMDRKQQNRGNLIERQFLYHNYHQPFLYRQLLKPEQHQV